METLPLVLQQFITTTNAADSDGFIALFTDDGSINDWGNVYEGRDRVARWNQTDNIGKQSQFKLVDGKQTAPAQWCLQIHVAGNGFNGTSPFEFTLTPDQQHILTMVIVPD
ncbi:nuclear transport factor 2 family protein [Furfurilactobacillus siliginis]|uniref:SnoaL-like domain-containing protein n=1 Tax=Furfurilactobacillus siliginis TaxID=348151 RepID=A0A0R2L4I8_9LACO|nr:nuclear transport factor 2 family protein [Furfurilactobacillus siliginis]KRN96687.1 hypothetical protein IV55_GL001219 [Furfurilactobacillus siliginis]GEK29470.1 hypothetical protein LSI01_17810 [Furfurilactobacillus siliginis]